jgi:GxxExxY protein
MAMDRLPCTLKHSELTDRIIGVYYDVYNELGHGILESTYAEAIVAALGASGLHVDREVRVWFRGKKIGQYFADLLVERTVMVELKAGRTLEKAHEAQLLHYLRATEIEVGLLISFGIHPPFRRLLFDNERKTIRENPRESVANSCG